MFCGKKTINYLLVTTIEPNLLYMSLEPAIKHLLVLTHLENQKAKSQNVTLDAMDKQA